MPDPGKLSPNYMPPSAEREARRRGVTDHPKLKEERRRIKDGGFNEHFPLLDWAEEAEARLRVLEADYETRRPNYMGPAPGSGVVEALRTGEVVTQEMYAKMHGALTARAEAAEAKLASANAEIKVLVESGRRRLDELRKIEDERARIDDRLVVPPREEDWEAVHNKEWARRVKAEAENAALRTKLAEAERDLKMAIAANRYDEANVCDHTTATADEIVEQAARVGWIAAGSLCSEVAAAIRALLGTFTLPTAEVVLSDEEAQEVGRDACPIETPCALGTHRALGHAAARALSAVLAARKAKP